MLVKPETMSLLDEVKKNPIAFRMLKDKCEWEQMSLTSGLSQWGDPRRWAGYMAKVVAEGGSAKC